VFRFCVNIIISLQKASSLTHQFIKTCKSRLERDTNQRPFGRKAPNSPMRHPTPH